LGDDTEFVHGVCQTFLTTVSQLLNEMNGAARAGERPLLRALAHKIKGAANNLHAHRVATLATQIESESANMRQSELSQRIAALRQPFDEVTAHVSSELR